MPTYLKRLYLHAKKHIDRYVIVLLTILSLASSVYFFHSEKHLMYGDALSRLNISRKIVDNLTPGLAQVGNVWLPLPQLLMLPFVWINPLWHSGAAGTIVSSVFFILGGYFLFKSSHLLTNSITASFLGLLVYALDTNLLYMQTTAMSETSFIAVSILITYFFICWTKKMSTSRLLFAAISVSALTLIRYEALAILPMSSLFVGLYSFVKNKKYKKAEGEVVLFTTLAGLGFALWTLYLWIIFGDPLYWIHYYVVTAKPVANAVAVIAAKPSFFASAWKYFTAVVWMNGLIPVALSLIGFCLMVVSSIRQKTLRFFPVFLQLSFFLFMILTLMRNTPIGEPSLSIQNIFSNKTNHVSEFNIRYGMMMLPFIALTISYLINRKIYVQLAFLLLFSIQIVNYVNPSFTSIYQFAVSLDGPIQWKDSTVDWMTKNYDGGLILISAEKHDPMMFELGLNYNRYIHEGTADYWHDSLKKPAKYATWIVTDFSLDEVGRIPLDSGILERDYTMVYSGASKIYKIKTKPDILIEN